MFSQLAVATAVALSAVFPAAGPTTPITIDDPNLRSCINTKLALPAGNTAFEKADLESILDLECESADTTKSVPMSLIGLQHLKNLEGFSTVGYNPTSYDVINEIPSIKYLDFVGSETPSLARSTQLDPSAETVFRNLDLRELYFENFNLLDSDVKKWDNTGGKLEHFVLIGGNISNFKSLSNGFPEVKRLVLDNQNVLSGKALYEGAVAAKASNMPNLEEVIGYADHNLKLKTFVLGQKIPVTSADPDKGFKPEWDNPTQAPDFTWNNGGWFEADTVGQKVMKFKSVGENADSTLTVKFEMNNVPIEIAEAPAAPDTSVTAADTKLTVKVKAEDNSRVVVEYRTVGGTWSSADVQRVDPTTFVINNLKNGTKYEIRTHFVTADGRTSDFTTLTTSTTGGTVEPGKPDPNPGTPGTPNPTPEPKPVPKPGDTKTEEQKKADALKAAEDKKKADALANTGAESMMLPIVAGGLLAAGGATLLVRRRLT